MSHKVSAQPLTEAYLNRVVTAVPPHNVHRQFTTFAPSLLKDRERGLFRRMAQRSQIEHRYSFLKPATSDNELDGNNFYRKSDFPTTAERMRFYQAHALTLAKQAIDQLNIASLRSDITHVIVTSCTGFYAPGLDLEIVENYGLNPSVERSFIGFMGCYAAFNALKLARHIVRSTPEAKILVVNLELCTLHLQLTEDIGQLLSYLIFADGCAASLISAETNGLKLDSFYTTVMPDSTRQITWAIGDQGFDMHLSGEVPTTIAAALPDYSDKLLNGVKTEAMTHWAIHPGGRSILDAVQKSFGLTNQAMQPSRTVLRDYGNMSSATIMFVLKTIMESSAPPGPGCAMAFGPGVTLESMLFTKVVA